MTPPKEDDFPPMKGSWHQDCVIEAPDGEILSSRAGPQKANWYLSKDLAEQVKEDPFTIRLKSEPSGRPVGVCDKYYQTPQKIRCVVCGQTESCVRKNIVPKEYRKHLPNPEKPSVS